MFSHHIQFALASERHKGFLTEAGAARRARQARSRRLTGVRSAGRSMLIRQVHGAEDLLLADGFARRSS